MSGFDINLEEVRGLEESSINVEDYDIDIRYNLTCEEALRLFNSCERAAMWKGLDFSTDTITYGFAAMKEKK